jgi:hypothetical protein
MCRPAIAHPASSFASISALACSISAVILRLAAQSRLLRRDPRRPLGELARTRQPRRTGVAGQRIGLSRRRDAVSRSPGQLVVDRLRPALILARPSLVDEAVGLAPEVGDRVVWRVLSPHSAIAIIAGDRPRRSWPRRRE